MVKKFLVLLALGLVGGTLFQSRAQDLQAQPRTDESVAFVKVKVPADATLEVDGVKLKSTGPLRILRTPFLPVGKYSYTFKASFTVNGKAMVVEKKVIVEPGKEVELDFLPETPKKVEIAKEEPKKTPEISKNPPIKEEKAIPVPYVPTPQLVVDAMLKLAEVKEGDVVYDLGCGDGRLVITAVKKFKAKKGVGIELFPPRVALSKENAKKEDVADKVEIREGDVLELKSVADADVVTLYLLPDINEKLRPMLLKTLKPGARIVSHDFKMGDWKWNQEIAVKVPGDREHTIYLWVIPDPNKKVEPKKEEPKKETPKKDEPKKDTPKKEEPKKDTPKVDEPKKDTPKVEPKKEEEFKTIRVPYVPTPQPVVDKMLELAGVKEGDVVWDLGCGDGRIVVTAVKKFKAKRGVGIDLDPARLKDSANTAKEAGVTDKVQFKQGDVLKITDLSDANVVTLYLYPEVNLRLMPVLLKTLKPGSRVVSHDFDMGDEWKPEKTVKVGDDHTIYLWTIPEKKK